MKHIQELAIETAVDELGLNNVLGIIADYCKLKASEARNEDGGESPYSQAWLTNSATIEDMLPLLITADNTSKEEEI